ncbi:MAG: hypothetical protein IT376_05910 [Polyangiaceae bacterium]|nr:hypothetical protein [Polyangiaceae bacterium]
MKRRPDRTRTSDERDVDTREDDQDEALAAANDRDDGEDDDEDDDEDEDEEYERRRRARARRRRLERARLAALAAEAGAGRSGSDDGLEVTGGRLLVAAGIIGLLVLTRCEPFVKAFRAKEPPPTNFEVFERGAPGEVSVTLITADQGRLACASDRELEGHRCEYKTDKERWPPPPGAPADDNKANVIQPYRTSSDNKLIMIAGLWAEPTLALRLHREPPGVVEMKKQARFVATCKVRPLGKLDSRVRWDLGQPWSNDGVAWVVKAEQCRLGDSL